MNRIHDLVVVPDPEALREETNRPARWKVAMVVDRPSPGHRRPEGLDTSTVFAVGLLTEALERAERARGHLYAFHQLTGEADFKAGDAVDALRTAGHHDVADWIATELVGRNVIKDRWTFQIIEDYDDNYWSPFRWIEREVRRRLVGGRRHLHETELKESRRTSGHPNHTARPPIEGGRVRTIPTRC